VSPISRPSNVTVSAEAQAEYAERLAVVLTVLGMQRWEDLAHYLLSGDYSRLPDKLVRRLREVRKRRQGAPLASR